jgi:hypothetical protein
LSFPPVVSPGPFPPVAGSDLEPATPAIRFKAMTLRTRSRSVVRGLDLATVTAGRLRAGRAWRWTTRVLGAALLVGMAWIHQHLYDLGYSTVPTIGPLFRLNAVLGVVAALAVLITPTRWWRPVCAAGALLQMGTLAALVQSLTVGAFGFHETFAAPLVGRTIAVETAGFVVLAVGALVRTEPALASPPETSAPSDLSSQSGAG